MCRQVRLQARAESRKLPGKRKRKRKSRTVLDAEAEKYGDPEKYGCGLVDYEYAMSIYADCKRAYGEKGKTEPEEKGLEVNEAAPEVADYEDVDYVEGRWTKDTHKSLAEKKGSGITGDNLKVLKLGAVANDGNKTVKWSAILGKHTVNNKNKMLIVYGMALHVATDIFAHSTYKLDGKRIKHPDADKTYKDKENREECAEQIAGKVLQHTLKGEAGSVADFHLSVYNTGKDKKCFKLKRIARYIKAVNSTYYTKNKTYFNIMDVDL